MPEPSAALTYSSYLALDEVLAAQRPKTDEHDELLFIVIHQVYELWFKQLLHELVHLQRRLEAGEGPRALATVRRILTILKTVVAQIDVLETMTPSQFATFRARLDAASGFQSAQFRELEAVLGRRDQGALDAYEPGSPEHERIAEAMRRRSLFDSFMRYLQSAGLDVPLAALERHVGPRLVGVPGEQEPVGDAEHRIVARERVGAPAQVLRRERAGSRRPGAAHSCDRTAQRSGNIGWKSVVRRYAAPDDPPVPILSPIVRSTIFTWR